MMAEQKTQKTKKPGLGTQPRWDLDQDLALRSWWDSLLVYLRSEEDPNHKMEQLAASFIRKLVIDPDLRGRFRDDPAAMLSRFGIHVPKGVRVEVVENSPRSLYIVLPAMMAEDEFNRKYEAVDLADADLESFVTGKVAATLFQDDFDIVKLRDGFDHDVDVLPFTTDIGGDKFKTKPFNVRNDFFGA